MSREEVLAGFTWNETGIDGGYFARGLLAIFTIDRDGNLSFRGTAFVISDYREHVVAITAAHNLYEGVHKSQYPYPRYGPSALPEFFQTSCARLNS